MSQPPYVLVIDQGGHSTRALVFDALLNILAQSQVAISTAHPRDRFVEHDAAEVASSLWAVLADIGQQLGDEVRYVRSAGLACQRSSMVCWRKDTGAALTPVISWQDTRGHACIESIHSESSFIHNKTGLRLSPHYGASKMRWCLEHVPEVKAALENDQLLVGPLATWLVAQLTNNPLAKADAVNAARTLLMRLDDRVWDDGLCALFSIPRRVLPDIADNDFEFGEIDLNQQKISLRYVTGDQAAALFSMGKPDPDILYLNIGSGAFLQRVCEGGVQRVDGLLSSLVEGVNNRMLYSVEATINGAANALDWLAGREGTDVLGRLDEWLKFDTQALFINAVGGLASPWWRSDVASRFVGDSDIQSRAIAVIESIAFLLKVNLDCMLESGGRPSGLVVSGGLSCLDGLCSRLADLSGLNIYRLQEKEATASGVASRLLGVVEVKDVAETFKPTSNQNLWQRYQRWMREMEMAVS